MEKKDYLGDIGERIALKRQQAGLTQSSLAEKAGITDKHISVIETGGKAMRLSTMIKIGEILNIDYTYLITGKKITTDMLAIQEQWENLKPQQRDVILRLLEIFKMDNIGNY